MSAATLCALIALGAIALYAIFGGADFGGGVWDILASGPRRDAQRTTIGHAIGPVWETNHVWLIYVIVLLFTCFPRVFAALAIGLYVPLSLVLVGIILRGAAYAFRSSALRHERFAELWGHVFGVASILSPFFFGACVGGLTLRDFDWSAPFALALGAFAVALCAQVAAVFLTFETHGALREDFRARTIASTFALAAVGALALGLAIHTEPDIAVRFLRPPAGLAVLAAMALGLVVVGCAWWHRVTAMRVAVAAEVVAILCGWYAAQAPDLIPGRLTNQTGAAPEATLLAFLWLSAAGIVVLAPSLVFLFRVFKSPALE